MAGVRVRFAPSPTGMLHLGGARTALFNYLYAKSTGGKFILRIEDTDKERLVPGSVRNIQESLKWLGLNIDEGPCVGGDHGPYVQSERLHLYQHYAAVLVKSGNAYPCFCSHERLKALQSGGHSSYDGHCRALSQTQVQEKLQMKSPHTIRFKAPKTGNMELSDEVYGRVTIPNSDVTDQVLLKSDGFPTYHLASVVDDHCMEISHVLRGEEWLLSTAKHIHLFSAFNWTPPTYAHLPLLMSSSGGKLSKRSGDPVLEKYKEEGFQPHSIVNFLSLLGWGPSNAAGQRVQPSASATSEPLASAPGQSQDMSHEILGLHDLIRTFTLEGVNRKPAVVNEAKLLWMNRHYFKQKLTYSINELAVQLQEQVCKSHEIDVDDDLVHLNYLQQILLLLEDRIPFIPRIPQEVSYFWIAPTLTTRQLTGTKLDSKRCLNVVKKCLESNDFTSQESLSASLKDAATKLDVPFKQLIALTRLALTGVKTTPVLAAVMKLLGRETVLERLDHTLSKPADSVK